MGKIIGTALAAGALALGGAAIGYKEYSDYKGKRFNHTEEGLAWRDVYVKKGGKEAQVYTSAGNTEFATMEGKDTVVLSHEHGDKTRIKKTGSGAELIYHYDSPHSYKILSKEIDENSWENFDAQTGEKEIVKITDRGFYHDFGDAEENCEEIEVKNGCLLYTSPSPRDRTRSRMPSSA